MRTAIALALVVLAPAALPAAPPTKLYYLGEVKLSSADGQAFKQPLEEIARDGVPVQVLGFREHASWALASDTLEFVDLEDIDGVFREALPRIGLDSLPEQGAWLQPFRPLSALLTSRV